MGATGTVTEVDGDQVYAFGHPFYNLGPTQFPMTRAYVYTLLPSLSSSMKIADHRRRRSGRSGRIAPPPSPVRSAKGPTSSRSASRSTPSAG